MLSGLSVIHRERKACESMVKLEEEMAKIYLLFLHDSPGIPARPSQRVKTNLKPLSFLSYWDPQR